MSARRTPTTALEDSRLPVTAKLAAAWTSFMFLYVYVDIIGFYVPGTIDDILVGVVWEFDITQVWAVGSLAFLAVPSLMVVLSATLPARANRLANLVVASVYIPFTVVNVIGESWTFYYGLGVLLEVIVTVVILRLAWTWPRRIVSPATPAASLDRESLHTQHG